MKQFLWVSCLFISLLGCHFNSLPKLSEVHLSYNDPKVMVKLSDFIDSLEIIPLETNDSVLLPEFIHSYVGDKHVVIASSEAIYQFDKHGRFIRQMFSRGRGPGEFLYICSHYLDDENDRYYMTDYESHLYAYDLKKGKLLGRYSLPNTLEIIRKQQDKLICKPDFLLSRTTTPYTLCSITTQGKIMDILPDTIKNGDAYSLHTTLTPNGLIQLKTYKSDTVYLVDDFHKRPSYIVKGKFSNPKLPLQISLKTETRDYFFFHTSVLFTEYNKDGKVASIASHAPAYFKVNKHTFKSEMIEQIHIDLLGINLNFSDLHRYSKNTSCLISAIRFKESLDKKAQPLSPEIAKLHQQIKEDDNPLIFFGKTK